MYPTQLLDHFEHPRNAGDLSSPSASAQLENPVCGDVLRLTLAIENGNITAARVRAKGCVASIACGSLLPELITNHSGSCQESQQGRPLHSTRWTKP
ncbi:MAG: hypothetical protein DMG67_16755 [Acidobacteria bacterium]|nr:MAG: hypothetical protein DMG67_16755 [Acidobacteriota bacterium]